MGTGRERRLGDLGKEKRRGKDGGKKEKKLKNQFLAIVIRSASYMYNFLQPHTSFSHQHFSKYIHLIV